MPARNNERPSEAGNAIKSSDLAYLIENSLSIVFLDPSLNFLDSIKIVKKLWGRLDAEQRRKIRMRVMTDLAMRERSGKPVSRMEALEWKNFVDFIKR